MSIYNKKDFEDRWFDTNCYAMFSIYVAYDLGIKAAAFLQALMTHTEYLSQMGMDEFQYCPEIERHWIPLSIEEAYTLCALSRKEQDHAIDVLEENGLILKKSKGMPSRRCFIYTEKFYEQVHRQMRNQPNGSEYDYGLD